MLASLSPRVSDNVFDLAVSLIVKKELLFYNNVGFLFGVSSINTNTC